jgi:hypothetical protein
MRKLLALALLCALTAPAYAGNDSRTLNHNHVDIDGDGTIDMIDKENRDYNKAYRQEAKEYGEPDGDGGWISPKEVKQGGPHQWSK